MHKTRILVLFHLALNHVPGALSGPQTEHTVSWKSVRVWKVADHSRCSGNLIDVNELGKTGDDNKEIKRRTEEQIKG